MICSWDIRDLWPATHQISFYFLPKIIDRNCMKCIETHVSAVACVPMHFRHQTNIQFSVVGQCTGRPPKIICLIRVSSLNRRHLIDKNAVWFFTFLNHAF